MSGRESRKKKRRGRRMVSEMMRMSVEDGMVGCGWEVGAWLVVLL
jgi:hypothetical protein